MGKKQLAVVLAIIRNEKGEIFLMQRNDPKTDEHGKWEFPGGKVNFGESAEHAIVRETKEETGYDIEIMRLLPKIYDNVFPPTIIRPFTSHHVILISYECKIVGGKLSPDSRESLQGKFFNINQIDYSKCLDYTKEIIELLDK